MASPRREEGSGGGGGKGFVRTNTNFIIRCLEGKSIWHCVKGRKLASLSLARFFALYKRKNGSQGRRKTKRDEMWECVPTCVCMEFRLKSKIVSLSLLKRVSGNIEDLYIIKFYTVLFTFAVCVCVVFVLVTT